jgi:hypothetical protein
LPLLQCRPAGKSALPQSRRTALSELAALLRQRLHAARLLQARLIHRRRCGAARHGPADRGTLRRRAGWRADLSGGAGGLAWPWRQARTLRSARRLAGLLSALLSALALLLTAGPAELARLTRSRRLPRLLRRTRLPQSLPARRAWRLLTGTVLQSRLTGPVLTGQAVPAQLTGPGGLAGLADRPVGIDEVRVGAAEGALLVEHTAA